MKRHMHKRENGSLSIALQYHEESRTHQNFKDSSDINKIMKKYHAQGYNYNNLPQPTLGAAMDLTQIGDYQDALKKTLDAEHAFGAIPSEIRKKFNNNPQELIDFLVDPKNTEEAIILGLKQKPQTSTSNHILTELQNLNKNLQTETTTTQTTTTSKPSKPGPS